MKIKLLWLSLAFTLVGQIHAQRQDDMRQTVEYLASQELGGRYPGTAGDTLASEYIVGKLRSLKLKPIVKGKKKIGYLEKRKLAISTTSPMVRTRSGPLIIF